MMWWILAAAAAIAVLYWLLIRPHKYWLKKGVKQGTPWFILGDTWGAVFRRQSLAEMTLMAYNMVPNARYSGFYQFLLPTLIVKDPDLIKKITVKDFDHFVNHRNIIPEDCDPLVAKNLFSLNGEKWKEMRATLSPAFTSSKMKYMFTFISQNGEQFVNYFLKKNEDVITLEMKDTLSRFTNDVIANTVFGVQCDSLDDRENEFYLKGKEATDFTGFWKSLKLMGYLFIPSLFKRFKVRIFSRESADFFTNVVKSNISSRQKHGIVRLDMIHLLLEARKNALKHDESQPIQDTGFATVDDSEIGKNPKHIITEITDEDITAQALIFFFAGFDAVSGLMCFMSHELAVNPDIQDRLIEEVDETRETCKGKLTYEALVNMKYMDMVLSETLRKWPNNVAVDRVCTKPYTIEPRGPSECKVHLEKDALIWIPIYGLHRDPQHYPDPDRFNPERFSDENKGNIKPYTYLPFGAGPRNCIGSRFAILEAKTLFFYMLSHFQIVPVAKTQIPLILCKRRFNLTAEKGFWLGLKRRSKT